MKFEVLPSGTNSGQVLNLPFIQELELLQAGLWGFLLIYILVNEIRRTNINKDGHQLTILPQKIALSTSMFFIVIFSTVLYNWGLEKILLAFEYATSAVLAIFSPAIGVCLFIFMLISRQWEFTYSNVLGNIPFDFGFLMISAFIAHKLLKREFSLTWPKQFNYLLGFTFFLFLSVFKTGAVSTGLVDFASLFMKIILFMIIAVDSIKDEQGLKYLKMAIIVGVLMRAFTSLIFTIYQTTGDIFSFEKQVVRLAGIGSLGNSNDLATILIMALPLTILAVWKLRILGLNYLIATSLLSFNFYLIWYTRSRGALVSILSMVALFGWQKIKNKGLFLTGLVLLSLTYFPISESFKRDQADLSVSSENRLNYWHAGLNMAVRNPILGVGYDMYPKLFEQYAPSLKGEWGERTAHSTWILVLAETGFIGFAFYMAFFIGILRSSWGLRRIGNEYPLMCVGYLVAISFLSQAYLYYPYIMASLVLCANNIYKETDEALSSHRMLEESIKAA